MCLSAEDLFGRPLYGSPHPLPSMSSVVGTPLQDSILTMYHLWAMQQASMEEAVENPNEPKWRLREMQQLGMQQLI